MGSAGSHHASHGVHAVRTLFFAHDYFFLSKYNVTVAIEAMRDAGML
jgi:hypothetical protein